MTPSLMVPGTLAVLLAAVVVLEAADGFGPPPAPELPPPARVVPAPARAAAAPAQTATLAGAVLARPLFSPGRRPAAAAAAGAEPAAAEPDRLPRLTGLVISGADRSVLFAGSGGGKPVLVAQGGHLGAFTVRSIEADAVTVVSAAGVQVLHPSFDPSAAPPSAAAAASAPGAGPNYPTLQDIFRNGAAPPQASLIPPSRTQPVPPSAAPLMRPVPRERDGR